MNLVGQTIAGRYTIDAVLGAGGMGVVYRATQIAMNRSVAVKLLHAQSGQNAVARFEREMQATARIEHPNTIRVYDYGALEDGRLYLAMELLSGVTLAKTLAAAGGPLPLERIVRIGTQIGKALIAAHAEGVVHRDLKPDNVMLQDRYGERDFVRVLDFGIARFVEGGQDQQLTAEGAVIGTPAYMSPEQVHGKAPDARTDLYALGIILYEMLTGAVPFAAATTLSLLVKHAQEAPRPPSEAMPRDDVPPELEALVLQCLAKDPDARPQSAEEIVHRLEVLAPAPAPHAVATPSGGLRDGGLREVPTAPGTSTVTHDRARHAPAKRPLWPWLAAAGLVVALVVVVVVLASGGKKVAPVASAPTPVASAPPATTPSAPPATTPSVPTASSAAPDVAVAATDAAPPSAPDATPAEDPRAPLAALFAELKEPDVPESCKTRGPAGKLEVITKIGRLLAGGGDSEAYQLATQYKALLADSVEGMIYTTRATLRAVQLPSEAMIPGQAAVRLCDCAAAHYQLAEVYRAMDHKGGAYDEYRAAHAREPDWFEPLAHAVLLDLDRQRPSDAIGLLDNIVRRKPDFAPPRVLRGAAYLMAGDGLAAAADLEIATRQFPDDGDAQFMLGQAKALVGELDAAQKAYCKAKALGHTTAAEQCKDGSAPNAPNAPPQGGTP